MGKQKALFHKNTDGRRRMVPIQDDSVQWMYTEYPPTSPFFAYCITMGKQNALFHKNTDGRGHMLPIQMIVYNGCTQNIHQRPNCLYITLSWGNKALFHKYNNLRTLYENVNKESSDLKMNMSQLENEISIERNDMSNWLLYWHQ